MYAETFIVHPVLSVSSVGYPPSSTAIAVTSSAVKLKNPFKKKNRKETKEQRDDLLESIRNGTASRARSFIVYDYCIYWGYFTNFSYTESATDKPRQFSYNFTFKVVNSTTDWLSQSLISNFPEARILNFFNQIGESADYIISQTLSMDKVLKGIMLI